METITLGLSFSTRMLGLAVIKSNNLIDYCLKLHKEKWSEYKQDLILASLASCIAHYTITDVVLSMPDTHCLTEEFLKLVYAVESFSHEHNIKTVRYQAKEIYRAFGSPVRRTRNALMKRMALFYPELQKYYDKERANKNKYYIKLFEAVAVSAYHWLKQNQK
jgi:hypothetical protein